MSNVCVYMCARLNIRSRKHSRQKDNAHMHTCMHTCMHAYTQARWMSGRILKSLWLLYMRIHIHAYIHVYVEIQRSHARVHRVMQTYICGCVHIRIHGVCEIWRILNLSPQTLAYIHLHKYIYIHAHAHTHTHTHTHTGISQAEWSAPDMHRCMTYICMQTCISDIQPTPSMRPRTRAYIDTRIYRHIYIYTACTTPEIQRIPGMSPQTPWQPDALLRCWKSSAIMPTVLLQALVMNATAYASSFVIRHHESAAKERVWRWWSNTHVSFPLEIHPSRDCFCRIGLR